MKRLLSAAVGWTVGPRTFGIGSMVALTIMLPPGPGAHMLRAGGLAGADSTPTNHPVLTTVTAIELSRFDIRLKPFPWSPAISWSKAVHAARVLAPGQKVLEAVPALVRRSTDQAWVADWVVSLMPYSGLQRVPVWPGHPVLNKPQNRRPFLLVFVSERTGKYDGEAFEFWRGHFWRYPCTYIPFQPTAYFLDRGHWQPAPVIVDKRTGERNPILRSGTPVRLSISVRPAACLDRFSRVELYFRRAFVGSNGVTQFRNPVGGRA